MHTLLWRTHMEYPAGPHTGKTGNDTYPQTARRYVTRG